MKKKIMIFACLISIIIVGVTINFINDSDYIHSQIRTQQHALVILSSIYTMAHVYKAEKLHFPMTKKIMQQEYNISLDYTYESDGETFLASVIYKKNKIFIDQNGAQFDHKMRFIPDPNRLGEDIQDLTKKIRNKANESFE